MKCNEIMSNAMKQYTMYVTFASKCWLCQCCLITYVSITNNPHHPLICYDAVISQHCAISYESLTEMEHWSWCIGVLGLKEYFFWPRDLSLWPMTLTFYAKPDIIQVHFHGKLHAPRSNRTIARLIKAFGLVHWGVGSERFFGLKDTKSSRSKKASWHWPNYPNGGNYIDQLFLKVCQYVFFYSILQKLIFKRNDGMWYLINDRDLME